MPAPTPRLTVEDVHRFVDQRCFGTATGSGRVGAEVEWLVYAVHDSTRRAPLEELRAATAAAALSPGGVITFEPGGQIEISAPPGQGVTEACATTAEDLASVRTALTDRGLALVGMGLDPLRPHRRVAAAPRYEAMEAYFDSRNAEGRVMMCGTASIQVNLDLGPPGAAPARWRLAHRLGPVLAAAFANSPFVAGRPSGWRSSRLATWAGIDRCRTTPVLDGSPSPGRPAENWARYALDACVMLVRPGGDRYVPLPDPLPFARWLDEGHPLGYPTEDDLAYHLTTLFPPVRPRGWLELRMVDSLPDPWWRAAVALTAAVMDDPEAAAAATQATAHTGELWTEAARTGLSHPALAEAARLCFASGLAALPRLSADAGTQQVCAAFVDRYVERGRCPADDLLDRWAVDDDTVRLDHEEVA